MFNKHKPVELKTTLEIGNPEITNAPLYEHFAGNNPDKTFYDVAGCRVQLEGVIVRTYAADPFTLAVKIGDQWYNMCKVRPEDPGIQEIFVSGKMIEYGLSPQQKRHMEEVESKRKERLEIELSIKERARAKKRERLEMGRKRHEAAVKARNASMGYPWNEIEQPSKAKQKTADTETAE